MTETEKKALALVKAVISAEQERTLPIYADKGVLCEALFRAIEQHEAFKREVSDAVTKLIDRVSVNERQRVEPALSRFIIAKPDPLVEAMQDWWDTDGYASIETFRAAIEARGGRIVWEGE